MAKLKCDQCLNDRPIDEFDNLQVATVCRSCMTGESEQKARNALTERTKDLARRFGDLSTGDVAPQLARVSAILAEIYDCFGGPRAYAEEFFDTIMELKKRRPIPASVGHLQLNVLKLHHAIDMADDQATARDLTNDQLQKEMSLAMMQLAMEAAGDPEKRRMLERMLGRQGLVIREAEPEELVKQVTEHLGQLERSRSGGGE